MWLHILRGRFLNNDPRDVAQVVTEYDPLEISFPPFSSLCHPKQGKEDVKKEK